MGQVVFRMLAEAGYLKSTRKLELQRVIVRAELRSLLEEHYKQRIKDLWKCRYGRGSCRGGSNESNNT